MQQAHLLFGVRSRSQTDCEREDSYSLTRITAVVYAIGQSSFRYLNTMMLFFMMVDESSDSYS